jgi:hypothetical protein
LILKKVFLELKNENQKGTEFNIYDSDEAWNAMIEMVN